MKATLATFLTATCRQRAFEGRGRARGAPAAGEAPDKAAGRDERRALRGVPGPGKELRLHALRASLRLPPVWRLSVPQRPAVPHLPGEGGL